ncbi:hypothetical protein Y695_01357 [Hydrogenophaga sp. T4]|nr:hypothetical protein Y695_01357 [Hydrogenophaga sp. T4]
MMASSSLSRTSMATSASAVTPPKRKVMSRACSTEASLDGLFKELEVMG